MNLGCMKPEPGALSQRFRNSEQRIQGICNNGFIRLKQQRHGLRTLVNDDLQVRPLVNENWQDGRGRGGGGMGEAILGKIRRPLGVWKVEALRF